MIKQLKSLVIAATLVATSLTVSSNALANWLGTATYPTILIHGYLGEFIIAARGVGNASVDNGHGYFGNLPIHMRSRGSKIEFFTWDSAGGVNDDVRAKLDTKINEVMKQYGVNKVNLVGHSFGGLLIRSYFLERPGDRVKINRIATIGTPHQGTYAATIPDLIRKLCNILPTGDIKDSCFRVNIAGGSQMLPDSAFLNDLNDPNNTNDTGIGRSTSVASYYDEVVFASSALGWQNSAGSAEEETYTCSQYYRSIFVHMSQLNFKATAEVVSDWVDKGIGWGLQHNNDILKKACIDKAWLNSSLVDET